jgi:hypothetical protein
VAEGRDVREELWLAIHKVQDRHDMQAPLNHVNTVEWVDAAMKVLADQITAMQHDCGRDVASAYRTGLADARRNDATTVHHMEQDATRLTNHHGDLLAYQWPVDRWRVFRASLGGAAE